MELNSAQMAAVSHDTTPLFVLAGAGTGKTAVLTARIASLLQRGVCLPNEILAVTFTNKAARSLQMRLLNQIGPDANKCSVGTFHRIAGVLLRKDAALLGLGRDYVIYDTADQVQVIKACLKQQGLDPKVVSPKSVLHHIESWKNQGLLPIMLTPQQVPYEQRNSLALYAMYQATCRAANGVDFNDLLLLVVQLLQQFPQALNYWRQRWRCILVDEYQDTNMLQYKFLKALVTSSHSITVVGDDDQAIYGWRGAKIEHILRFEQDFPPATLIRLERSYRCCEHILQSANELIAHNLQRKGKTLYGNGQAGDKLRIVTYPTERDEAIGTVARLRKAQQAGLAWGEMAILMRTNAQARPIEEALQRAGIPYVVVGGMRFYDRKEMKDMLALLRILHQPHSDVDLLRIMGLFGIGIGARTVALLQQHSMSQGQSLWTTLRQALPETLFPRRAITVLERFTAWCTALQEQVTEVSLSQLFATCLQYTGYLERLREADRQDDGDRVEHVLSLQRSIQDYEMLQEQPSLQRFLEDIALATDVADMARNPEQHPLTLLTLHAAKGLEFTNVWLIGMEEGLLPHERSLQQIATLEEERRLCYVGMTRAKQQLTLSWVQVRSSYGMPQVTMPSRFLQELPAACCQEESELGVQLPWTEPMATDEPQAWSARPTQSNRQQVRTSRELTAASTEQSELGAVVQHATFGMGKIIAQQGSGKEKIYTIDFASHGKKTVVARFVIVTAQHGSPSAS